MARGDEVITDLEAARSAVFAAWAYGPTRAVPPLTVAQAMVVLLPEQEEPRLVADAERATYLRRLGVPGVDVPVETEVEGFPAVSFWYGTGSNPAQEVVVLAHPDHRAELRYGRAHSGG